MPLFKIHGVVTLLVLGLIAVLINRFFGHIQSRLGYQISDPLLNVIPAYDVSFYIFGIVYISLLTGLICLMKNPWIFLRAAESYCLLTLMRVCTIYLFPLEPPPSMIPLKDPFIDEVFYRSIPITKDLFFSGHVSTTFLFVLSLARSNLKFIFVILTFVIAVLMLVQHAHYTIDILAAPVFAWMGYRTTSLLNSGFSAEQMLERKAR